MTSEILTNGTRWPVPSLILQGCGASLVVAGMFLPGVERTVVVSCGGALVVIGWCLAYRNSRRSTWVQDTGSGFVITDRHGRREFADEQVSGIGHELKRNFSGGVLKSVCHCARLWTGDESTPIELRYKVKEGKDDPIGPLIGRLLENLSERQWAAFSRGETIAGEGWTFDRSEVKADGPKGQSISAGEVAWAGVFDGSVCVWARGEEMPRLRVPCRSRNAFVLQRVLEKHVQARHAASPAAADVEAGGMGRVLFERRPGVAEKVLAAVLVAGGVAGICFSLGHVIGLLVGGGAIAAGVALCFRSTFRCHQLGVVKSNPWLTRRLRYDEVASFTYGATRMYVNGVYTGTSLTMALEPFKDLGLKAIRYSTTVKNVDEDIENLRDYISRVIAARLLEAFDRGETVRWTDNLTLETEGLAFAPPGVIGRKATVHIPYDAVERYGFDSGVFHVWTAAKKKSVVHESLSLTNFFPGFHVFLEILSRRQAGNEPAAAAAGAPREAEAAV